MKKIALATTIALAGLFTAFQASAAPAAQATKTFDVNINLTTGCVITVAPTAVQFTYTAFGSAAGLDANGAFKVQCTDGLAYTVARDNSGSYTDNATNLAYTLSLDNPGATGNGAEQAYVISGNM